MVSLQQNMMTQDDLAALLYRNLTFNSQPQAVAPREELAPVSVAAQPIIYSISQHYNHSAHVARIAQPTQIEHQRPSSEPPQSEVLNSEDVLRNHGVDPTTLTPSQMQLYRIADQPQQTRLMELWSICPPTKGGDIPALAWSSTTLEQEEHMARLRYERSAESNAFNHVASVQTSNGKWAQAIEGESEPYMESGYEELMRRENERENERQHEGEWGSTIYQPRAYNHATDPAYNTAGNHDYANQLQQLEAAQRHRVVDAMDFS
ncbi:hypothetical protein G7046_g4609 [Stylonectria norvegica]|nr:hypothetical protein G7046_g4609 [Stylonectria norvegica]